MLEFDEPPIKAWSLARLRNYETCPYRVGLEVGKKAERPPEDPNGPLARGSMVHDHIEAYIKGEHDELIPEVDKPQLVEIFDFHKAQYADSRCIVEEEWAFKEDWQRCEWMSPDTWLRLKVDAASFLNPSKTSVLLDDWKTGKSWGKEIVNYEQGVLYAICMFMLYPEVQDIKVRFVYTDENKVKNEKDYTRDSVARPLTQFMKRSAHMTMSTTFPAKPNRGNCHFCPYGPNNAGNDLCPHGVRWE